MENVVVFGASGNTGQYIIRKLESLRNIELTAFVRNPDKLGSLRTGKLRIVQGDALNFEDVKRAVEGQKIIICSLEGDVLAMARNILKACKGQPVHEIVWITGMGIHHEIKGIRGKMLDLMAMSRPTYIEAADLIAESPISSVLLRCPEIRNGTKSDYELTREGEQPSNRPVDRAAIAQFMADLILRKVNRNNQSYGITNQA